MTKELKLPDGPMDVVALEKGTYGGMHGCQMRQPGERFTITNGKKHFSHRWMAPHNSDAARKATEEAQAESDRDTAIRGEMLEIGGVTEENRMLRAEMAQMKAMLAELRAGAPAQPVAQAQSEPGSEAPPPSENGADDGAAEQNAPGARRRRRTPASSGEAGEN